MSTNVEKIKDKIDIVDLIGSYIKTEKAGANYKARCPFHNEKTPSFFISPERQSFYCFGCGEGGDVFSFVEKYEGLDFMGALKNLADRAGIVLSNESFDGQVKNKEKEILFEIHEEASKFFEDNLRKNKSALEYLEKRGILEKTIESFRLGFAPESWDSLKNHLKNKGFKEEDIYRGGLLKKKDDRYYDTFRSRIMFPITDTSNRVIAFSGRIFGIESEAKYLNSPETPIFIKSKALYGIDKARSFIREKDFAILVEGQMDLIAVHQAGYVNTVASSGTSFSEDSLNVLGRFTKNILLVFDADSAGIRASGRVARIALPLGFNVKVALLPKGMDPSDLLEKDKEKWHEVLKGAEHVIEFYLNLLMRSSYDERKKILEVNRIVLPYVALIENKLDQAHFVKVIAEKIKLREETIWSELSKVDLPTLEREKISSESQPKINVENQLQKIHYYAKKKGNIDIVKKIEEKYKEIAGKELVSYDGSDEMMFQMDIENENTDIDKIVDELLSRIEKQNIQRQLSENMDKLKRAEDEKDEEKIKNYLKICQELAEKLQKNNQS